MNDIKKLKQLREETNVSYSLCKEALEEAKGDVIKAREILRQKGAEFAAKKSARETSQGAIFSYIHHNKKMGSMLELLCETDFVAINEDFLKLGNNIVMHIASTAPKDAKELMKAPFIKDPTSTIQDILRDAILKLGENVSIGRFERFEL